MSGPPPRPAPAGASRRARRRRLPRWGVASVVLAAVVATACGTAGPGTGTGAAAPGTDPTTGTVAAAEGTGAGPGGTAPVGGEGIDPTEPDGPPGGCPSPGVAPGRHERTITVAGTSRSYQLYVPEGLEPDRAVPLVATFHGLASSAPRQLAYSRLTPLADDEGFVVVAPQALGSPSRWDITTPATTPTSDAAAIGAILDEVESLVCIDPDRVYATGISLGSALVFAAACGGAGRFAAFGGVAATFFAPSCESAPPAPIRYFHGTADPIVPVDGGRSLLTTVEPARDELAAWAAHNGCTQGPDEQAVAPTVTRITWSGCRDGAEVVYDELEGGGHTWPGAASPDLPAAFGPTNDQVDATRELWDFFVAHPRRS